jgi:hypothetical protein
MHFQIHEGVAPASGYNWELVNARDEVICRGPEDGFDTEREARSQIAQAKRTMAGAGRYKVRSPE